MSWIAAGVGSAMVTKGVYDKVQADKAKKKAAGQMPPLEDSETRQYLGYIDRKRKSIENGSAYARQANVIDSQLANTDQGIASVSGGNAGAAISGMVQAGRGAGESYGDLVEKNIPLQLGYENMYGHTLDQIAHRKAELQLNLWKQAQADAAELQRQSQQEIMGGISMGAGAAQGAASKGGGGGQGGGGMQQMSMIPTRQVSGGGSAPVAGESSGMMLRTEPDYGSTPAQGINPSQVPSRNASPYSGGNPSDYGSANVYGGGYNGITDLRRKSLIPQEGYGG